VDICYMQVYLSRNYIPMVILFSNYTSPPSTAATFLAIYLKVVLQPSRYCQDYRKWTLFLFISSLTFIFFWIYFVPFLFLNSEARIGSDWPHQSHLMMWSQHWSRDLGRRVWNEIISHNIDTTCRPHALYMVI